MEIITVRIIYHITVRGECIGGYATLNGEDRFPFWIAYPDESQAYMHPGDFIDMLGEFTAPGKQTLPSFLSYATAIMGREFYLPIHKHFGTQPHAGQVGQMEHFAVRIQNWPDIAARFLNL